jgi:hypothetical protein
MSIGNHHILQEMPRKVQLLLSECPSKVDLITFRISFSLLYLRETAAFRLNN